MNQPPPSPPQIFIQVTIGEGKSGRWSIVTHGDMCCKGTRSTQSSVGPEEAPNPPEGVGGGRRSQGKLPRRMTLSKSYRMRPREE